MGDEVELPVPDSPKVEGKESQDEKYDEYLVPCDVIFAFGPDSSFFFKAYDIWCFSIAQKTMKTINSMSYSELYIAAITPDEGFMAAYKDKNGSPVWLWAEGNNQSMQNIPHHYGAQLLLARQEIFNKLTNHTDLPSLQQSSLSFGPGGSFFARVKYTAYYASLPSSLQAKIESNKKTAAETNSDRVFPLQVALGVGGAWVVIWSDKSYSWNLGSQYDALHNILSTAEDDGDKPAFVALSPYKPDDYFVVRRNGFIGYSVSNLNDKASAYLNNITNAYMQLRAQKDEITYTNLRTTGNVTKSFVIGPETKFPTEWAQMKDKYIVSTSQQSVMQRFLDPKRAEMWRRVQLENIRRRDLIPITTAGLCTAMACNYAGLPKRMTVSATVGAIAGTGTCCWVLNMLSGKE